MNSINADLIYKSNFRCGKSKYLSILIPTYNRSTELMLLLEQIFIKFLKYQHLVEIIISDNNSKQAIRDEVLEFLNCKEHELEIYYYKQRNNIGATFNVLYLVGLANGKYLWNIGDDDFLSEHAEDIVLRLIQRTNEKLILLRTSGIYEWNIIPKNTTQSYFKISINSRDADKYIMASGFLGSVLLENNSWKEAIPEVYKLAENYDNLYPHWHALLINLEKQETLIVQDETVVLGNYNMLGDGRIPVLAILVFGRIRVWESFKGKKIYKILHKRMRDLLTEGWKSILAGKANDINTFSDKLNTLKLTIKVLNFAHPYIYLYVIFSFIIPLQVRKYIYKLYKNTKKIFCND